jgi:hypothetical protein
MMTGILKSFSVVFFLLGMLAVPVATVWLLVLRQWWVPALVIAVWFLAPLILMVLMVPGVGLAAAAAKTAAKSRSVGLLLGFLGLLYVAALITAWCMGTFTFLLQRMPEGGFVPTMLLIYAIGAMPWKRMAREGLREGRRGEVIQMFFAQLALVVMLGTYATIQPEPRVLWMIFGSVMLIEVIVYLRPSSAAAGPRPQPSPTWAQTF